VPRRAPGCGGAPPFVHTSRGRCTRRTVCTGPGDVHERREGRAHVRLDHRRRVVERQDVHRRRHRHLGQRDSAVVGRHERGVRGVTAGGDPQHRRPRGQAGGVDQPPRAVHPGLGHGVEVHGVESGRVDGREAGGDVAGPQQRQYEVRVVAADARAEQQRVDGVVGRAAGAAGVGEPVVHPCGDGGDEFGIVADGAELVRGDREQLVRRAVAARAAVLQEVGLAAVGHLARAVDGRDVVDHQVPGGDVEHMHAPPVPAVDLAQGDGGAVAGDDQLFRGCGTGDGDLHCSASSAGSATSAARWAVTVRRMGASSPCRRVHAGRTVVE
jgi:hypothetical protein